MRALFDGGRSRQLVLRPLLNESAQALVHHVSNAATSDSQRDGPSLFRCRLPHATTRGFCKELSSLRNLMAGITDVTLQCCLSVRAV